MFGGVIAGGHAPRLASAPAQFRCLHAFNDGMTSIMADTTTSNGTATSFTNTPQAKDDSYNYIEDMLRANSTLYNSATNTIYLDVMSNDLGGGAKTLFAVSDGDGNAITSDFERTSSPLRVR